MEISTIVFDFGNVLIGWDPRRVYRDVLESDSAIDAFLEEVGFAAWNLEQDRGRPWSDAVTELSTRFPHRRDLICAFDAQWEQSITGPIEGTVRILEKLHGAGYRLIGLTNWSSDKFALTRPRYEMFDLFEDIIVSGDVKLIKPDPEIFRLMLRRIGGTAAECLFIDDSAANIASAKSLGFRTIHFRNPEQLETELRALGIFRPGTVSAVQSSMAETKLCANCGVEMAGTAQFCPGCGTRTLPPAHAIPVPPPQPANAPVSSPTIAPVVTHAPAAGNPPARAQRSTFFIWVPIAVIGLGLLAWAVLSGLPFSGEPDRPKSRPMEVVTERSTPTATLTEISDTTPESDETDPAPVTAPRPAVNRTPAPVPVPRAPAVAAPVVTRSPVPAPVPQPVPTPPQPSRTAESRPGEEISDSEAAGVLRSFISSRDYGVSSDCLSVTSRGYRNVGYDLQATDRCTGRSIGRWRVDSKTREVFRQRPDGRYLRP